MIHVYSFKSVQDISDLTIKYSDNASKEFEGFLWTLGWPIDVQTHSGYKGNLGEGCITAPYFANMNIELIFKAPHLYRDQMSTSLNLSKSGLSKSSECMTSTTSDSMTVDDTRQYNSTKVRQKSSPAAVEKNITSEPDSIAIVWLEDIHQVSQLIDQLPLHIGMCLMVHPLQGSSGLYLIKIYAKTGVPEECLVNHYVSISSINRI